MARGGGINKAVKVILSIALVIVLALGGRSAAADSRSLRRAVGVVDFVLLHVVVVAMAQIAAWALIFTMVEEFHDYRAAFYHSAVNFTTLGYGDVVMSTSWRLLGPLEALNGVLVLSLSSAVLVSTFGHLREARHSMSPTQNRHTS